MTDAESAATMLLPPEFASHYTRAREVCDALGRPILFRVNGSPNSALFRAHLTPEQHATVATTAQELGIEGIEVGRENITTIMTGPPHGIVASLEKAFQPS